MEKEIEDLAQRILHEKDADIREQLIGTFIGFKELATKHIIEHILHDDWMVRYRVIKIIATIGVKEKNNFLIIEKALSEEKDDNVRQLMLHCLLNAQVSITTDFSKRVNGEKKLKKIPKFAEEEASKIKELFCEKKIVFREFVLCYGHPEYPSYKEEITFQVMQDQFSAAVEIIKGDFFGINAGSGFSGECPACETDVENVSVCPECELKLELDPGALMEYHPFGDFLAKEMEG